MENSGRSIFVPNKWANIVQIEGEMKNSNWPQWCSGSIRPSGGFDPGSIPGWGDF